MTGELGEERGPIHTGRTFYPKGVTEDPDRVSLMDLLRALWHRKWIILAAAAAGILAAVLIVRETTPTYTAQARVMLNAREGRVSTETAVVSDLTLNNPVVDSEVTSIKSNVLLGDVIHQIGPDRLAVLVPASEPSLLDLAQEWVRANVPSFGFLLDGEEASSAPATDDARTQRLIGVLKQNLAVARSGDSYVITIAMTSPDPWLSAEITNTVAAIYIKLQLEERRTIARRATLWLDERVEELRAQVEAAEAAVEQFRADQLILDGTSLDTLSQQLITFSNQISIAKADLAGVEARYDQIQELIAAEGITAAARVLTSPLVVSLRERLASAMRENAALATRLGPTNAERQQLQAEIARTEADLAQEISNIVDILQSDVKVARLREASMRQSLADLEQQMIKISQASIGQRQLEREASAVRQSYEDLLARLSETRTQEALQRADAKIIETANVPRVPGSPRTKLILATGGIVGGALGLGLVFFLELARTGFASAAELQAAIGRPVLTALPDGRWRSTERAYRALVDNPYSVYGERIRHLRTALLLGRQGPQSILLTSSIPGEGKTTTAIALAHMNALAKKSVILVDCDFRRPSLQPIFKFEAARGLGDLIRGSCSLDEAIVTDPRIGFSILPITGSEPLLADWIKLEGIEALIADLKARYDIVILDAPPILAVPDVLFFSKVVDISLYLVRWQQTPQAAVRQGLASLAEMQAPLPELVLSIVDLEKVPNAYYGSDYS